MKWKAFNYVTNNECDFYTIPDLMWSKQIQTKNWFKTEMEIVSLNLRRSRKILSINSDYGYIKKFKNV